MSRVFIFAIWVQHYFLRDLIFFFFCFCFQSLHAFLLFLRFFAISFHFAFAKHLCECKLQKLQHSKPRAELENLRVHFGTRHFLPKLYTNFKIT